MKTQILLALTIVISNCSFGQTDFCKDFRTGVYQYPGQNGGVYTIIRTDTNQFERNTKEAKHAYMTIKWLSDCQYVLFDKTVYKWGKAVKDTATRYNTVYKFVQPDKYFVKTYHQGSKDTIQTVLKKFDTSRTYNNLFQLSGFSAYKNSKSYGQTRLGEIHAIDYYENTKIKNQYLIVFETSYEAEQLNWSRLLDSTTIDIAEGQRITNSNCRFKGAFDDEIIAVYTSTNKDQEAQIIRAFRCNRQTEKIEAVDIKDVQYKESDRFRVKW